jgi:hypothetical protein
MFLTYIRRSARTDRAGRPVDVTPDVRARLGAPGSRDGERSR